MGDSGLSQVLEAKQQQNSQKIQASLTELRRFKGFLDTVREESSAAPKAWMLGRERTMNEFCTLMDELQDANFSQGFGLGDLTLCTVDLATDPYEDPLRRDNVR